MTPAEAALDYYGDDLADQLLLHATRGAIVATSETFCMGRLVSSSATLEQALDYYIDWDEPDAWFVSFVAGDLREALHHFPCYTPWVMFEREGDGQLRKVPMRRLIQHQIPPDHVRPAGPP